MIAKINELKNLTQQSEVKSICESAIAAFSSVIYNNVSPDAKFEIERVATENLFESLKKYKTEPVVNKWLENQSRLYALKNVGVRSAINSLSVTEGKTNKALMSVLEDFKERLEDTHEVLLYEAFISAVQPMAYFDQVNTAISTIEDRVKKYKTDIDIAKIIETMKDTKSNYLVPLIEDVVEDYIKNKNDQTKSFVKETLIKFSYDPFIRDIISLVTLDAQNLQLEYASGACDITKVYSPIIYISESEAVFNIKGTYYIKKSNNISKLNEQSISKLDAEFKAICEVINRPEVEVGDKDIKVYMGANKAVINENGVVINNLPVGNEEYKLAVEQSLLRGDTEFYAVVEALRRNFSEIAELNFAKRVFLKEDVDYAADVFKLRDNVFITTHDNVNNKTTLYRNVNPIQAKQIMMEHLRYDVSRLFENLLPAEEKILIEIEETKKEYDDYINLLEAKKEQFENNLYNSEVTDAVFEMLEEELAEIKKEYKEYLLLIEEYIRPKIELEKEPVEESVTVTIDVNGKKYTVPIPQEAEKGEEPAGAEVGGTEVGAEDLTNKAASAITFDDDKSEMISDEPSVPEDEVDLGVETIEDEADKAEEEKEGEEEEGEAIDSDETDTEEKTPEATNAEEAGEEGEEETMDLEPGEKKPKKKKEGEEDEEEEKKESVETIPFVKESTTKKRVFLKKKKKPIEECDMK